MRTEGWISEMGRQEGGVTGEKYREEHSWVSRGRNVGRQGGSGVNGEWKALSTPHSEVPRPAFVSCPPGGLHAIHQHCGPLGGEHELPCVFLQYEFTHLGLDLYLEVSLAFPGELTTCPLQSMAQ